MKRMAFFVYGVTGHLLFLAIYAWLAGFVGDLVVDKTIDSPASGSVPLALAIDLGLIAVFGLQHSIMARPAFKQVWTKIIPTPIERSTYVFASSAVTALLMWQWRAIDLVVWDVRQPVGRGLFYSLFALGWLMVPAVSLMIHHFDLFGTRQVWLYLRGREYTTLPFRMPMFYRRMRHPLYVGWAIAFWATPTMTVGHLLFAAGMTVYMLLAVVFEERDLIAHFGHRYEDYRRRVPMFVPQIGATLSAVRFNPRVLADPSWWHWTITVPLLAAHLAGIAGALAGAVLLCAVMSAYYLIRLRALRPFPVQLRLTYLVLLGAGTVPGLGGFHLFLLAGTTVMVTTGYCLLGRTLSLLSYNRSAPLSRSLVQRVLLSPVGDGGLFCWLSGEADSLPVGRCSLRSPLHHPAELAGNCEG